MGLVIVVGHDCAAIDASSRRLVSPCMDVAGIEVAVMMLMHWSNVEMGRTLIVFALEATRWENAINGHTLHSAVLIRLLLIFSLVITRIHHFGCVSPI